MWHFVISGGVIARQSASNCFKYYNLWYAVRFAWCHWGKISKLNIFHFLPASAVSVSDNFSSPHGDSRWEHGKWLEVTVTPSNIHTVLLCFVFLWLYHSLLWCIYSITINVASIALKILYDRGCAGEATLVDTGKIILPNSDQIQQSLDRVHMYRNLPYPLQWRHNGLSRLFAQAFVNIKDPCHWPLWGESTCDRRNPRSEGQ